MTRLLPLSRHAPSVIAVVAAVLLGNAAAKLSAEAGPSTPQAEAPGKPADQPAPPKPESTPAGPKREPRQAQPQAEAAPADGKPSEIKPAAVKALRPEPLLKFRFRFQRWIDVLEEVAKQAGLSLVLPEAPPPGTFNYSDDKQYTPGEAIDLLNGVLLTKGYTLIRRERMLVLVDLSEEIPEGLIEKISIEKLGERGRFEMVTVQFPLNGRPTAAVSEEIKPLLSPHGKVKSLAATGQLLVTDVRAVIEAISKVIESMPAPAPAGRPGPGAGETPSLVVYPIKKGDPETISKVLQTLLPAAKVLLDAKASQVNVYAGPTYQGVAKGVIEQMEAAPADKQPRLELYALDEAGATHLISTLQKMVPGATVSFDPRVDKLVAFATPSEQEAIKAAVEKLAVPAKPEYAVQFQVYRLSKLDPANLLPLLKILFPNARIVADTPTKSLIAIAPLADQKAIKTLLDQLQPEKPGPDTPELKFYPVAHLPTTDLVAALQKVAPGAQVTPDPGRKRVMAVATPAEHDRIKATLDQFEKNTPTYERNKLVVYPVTPAQRKRFESVLTKLAAEVPGIQVLPDTEPGELAIWTKAEQHKVIEELLAQFKSETPNVEKSVLAAYPATAADPTSVLDLMKKLHPTVQVVYDEKTGRLLVWAHPAEQLLVKAFLDQVQAPGTPSQQSRFETYAVRGADASTLLASLRSLVPGAKLTADSKTGRLVAWATPADHELLKGALEKLGHFGGGTLEGTPQVETYRLTKADPSAIVTMLGELVPDAKLTVDAQSQSLLVLAVPADQKTIRGVLEQLQRSATLEEKYELAAYPIKAADPASVLSVMKTLFPNVQFTLDAKARRLIAWTAPAEQAAIKAAMEKLDAALPADLQEKLNVYPAPELDVTVAISALQEKLPDARFSSDARAGTILAWGRQSDHDQIQETLKQMQEGAGSERKPRLVVYPVKKGDASSIALILRSLVPKAQLAADTKNNTVAATATPREQELIRSAIEQMTQEEPAETAHRLTIYTFGAGAAAVTSALPVLRAMYPNSYFGPGSEPGKLAAWARPAEQAQIKSTLAELDKEEPPETARRLGTYTIDAGRRGAINTLIAILSAQYPNARINAGLERGQILVWARPDDHKKIQATLDELTKNAPPPELGYKLSIYSLESGGSAAVSNAIGILRSMFPDAYVSSGSEPGKLVAWARPLDHPRIESIIKEVGKPEPPETAPRIVVYPLHAAPPSRGSPYAAGAAGVISVLRTMFPGAEFSPGTEPNKLVVLARPAEHKKIQAAVEELDKKEPPETAPRMAVYTVRASAAAGGYAAGSPITILSTMFPDAKFSAGTEPDKVVAWARPDDQKAIAQAVEAMSQKDPPGKARTMAAYTLETVGRYGDPSSRLGLVANLRQAFPDAIFFPGAGRNRLVAWARPEDHEAIEKAVEEMSRREPLETAPKVEVYEVESLGATAAVSFLATAFPDAQFSPGADPNKLIVRARPGDHELIQATIQQMEIAGAPAGDRALSVHPFKARDLTSFNQLLDPALKRNVQLVVDPIRNRLLVWGSAKHQEAIGKAIEQFARETAKAGDPTSEVYRFDWADPRAAYTVLSTLVPSANIALDMAGRSLVVSAMPEDHAKIKATIDAMDRRGKEGQGPGLEMHRMQAGDPAELLPILQGLFRLRPDVQLTLDAKNDAIVAFCTPGQHEMIRSLIAQVEKAISADSAARLQIYPMEDRETSSTLRMLNTVLQKQGVKAELSIDPRSRNLVAIARPEAHKRIQEVLDQLPAEKRSLEIVQLEVLDPSTAEMAIQRLFSDGLGYASGDVPTVDVDTATQQLFVRATALQHAKVRELLMKMGETGVAGVLGGEARRSRVIPFEGDLSAAVEEIRKVWPQLRSNPIHVVQPPSKISVQGRLPKKAGDRGGETPKPRVRPAAGPLNIPPEALPKNDVGPGAGQPRPTPPPAEDRAWRPNRPAGQTPSAGPTDAASEAWRASAAKNAASPADKPVVIIPGDGNITIASDDPEALGQIEQLLRAFSSQRGTIGRNYSIFMLENAKASQVASVLQNLFRRMPGTYARGPGAVTVVPDDRLNALVVYASRTDRTTIENLLKILDSAEMPETLSSDRLQMIPVKNTSAAVMERMLRDLYGNQIDSVSVEERTNSLVVMTSPATFDEIKRVVDLLDQQAGGESARTVQIVRLQSSTAERVGDALNIILPKAAPRAGRAVHRSSMPSTRAYVPEPSRRSPRRSSSAQPSPTPGRAQGAGPPGPRRS